MCTGSLLESNDILGSDIMATDVCSYDGNSIFDLESLVAETQPPPLVQLDAPLETSATTTSIADFSFSSWKIAESSAPGSPDSGFYSVKSPSSAGISEDESSPCETPVPVAITSTHAMPGLQVSAEDIQYLETLLQESANADPPSALYSDPHAPSTLALEHSVKLPIKTTSRKSPKASSRSTKSLSSTEKKERKRAQNKNAATRYREKKRAEANVVFDEQSKMEDKNRDLKDKVTLLTREIQYMKELLIEVYKTKGLIE